MKYLHIHKQIMDCCPFCFVIFSILFVALHINLFIHVHIKIRFYFQDIFYILCLLYTIKSKIKHLNVFLC